MSDDFDEQLFRAFTLKFVGRLPEQVVLAAIDYLDFGERRLAVENLCDELLEYEVLVGQREASVLLSNLRIVGGCGMRTRAFEAIAGIESMRGGPLLAGAEKR